MIHNCLDVLQADSGFSRFIEDITTWDPEYRHRATIWDRANDSKRSL